MRKYEQKDLPFSWKEIEEKPIQPERVKQERSAGSEEIGANAEIISAESDTLDGLVEILLNNSEKMKHYTRQVMDEGPIESPPKMIRKIIEKAAQDIGLIPEEAEKLEGRIKDYVEKLRSIYYLEFGQYSKIQESARVLGRTSNYRPSEKKSKHAGAGRFVEYSLPNKDKE